MGPLNFSKRGVAILSLCSIGIVYLLMNFNIQIKVHRGIVAEKQDFGWGKAALLQSRFGSVDDPSRLTVVSEAGDTLNVFGSGLGIEESDTIHFVKKESMIGFIYYIRSE